MCKPRATCTSRSASAHSSRRSDSVAHNATAVRTSEQTSDGYATECRWHAIRERPKRTGAQQAIGLVCERTQTARPKHGNERTDIRTGAGVLLLGVPADVRDVARDHRHDAVQAGKGSALSAVGVAGRGVSTQASNARPRPHAYSMGTVERTAAVPIGASCGPTVRSRTARWPVRARPQYGPCALRIRAGTGQGDRKVGIQRV